jgi:tetratricopeptide (TPR) repeat protein
MPDLNPIERRLHYLNGLWEQFAGNADARVLRWHASADARQMADVFVKQHAADPAGIPDLFLPFDVPFKSETVYALDLLRHWKEFTDHNRDDLIDNSIDPTWSPPTPRANEPGPAAVARAAVSFAERYGDGFRHLALVLDPNPVHDPAGWDRWLAAFAKSNLPANVRVLVIDDADRPPLAATAAADAKRVFTQTPEIDMSLAYRELAAQAGGKGPGVVFRTHFVGMLTAAKDGFFTLAEVSAAAALAVATAEKWADMQTAVRMALGSVQTAAGKPAAALAAFREAKQSAEAAAAAGHPAGAKLVVQSHMAEAGAVFADGKYRDAAALYEAAAPKADAADDPLLAMENWRMAAYCHEQNAEWEKAWACGEKALAAGERIAPDLRANTTLPFAGQGLLRLTARKPYSARRDALTKRMNALAGPGWEDRKV